MKIAIAGTGYVGLSNAVLLAQHNQVVALDIDPAKVALVNARQSPIEDPELQHDLAHRPLNRIATLIQRAACKHRRLRRDHLPEHQQEVANPRIGNKYNKPCFDYGGYRLPKDTKQLLANYRVVLQDIMRAVVDSNATRKAFCVADILKRNPKVVGIYRLVKKAGRDNYRSSIHCAAHMIKGQAIEVKVYEEPALKEDTFCKSRAFNDMAQFRHEADVIAANRMSPL